MDNSFFSGLFGLDTVQKASWLVVVANHERSVIVVMKSTWRASRNIKVSINIDHFYLLVFKFAIPNPQEKYELVLG